VAVCPGWQGRVMTSSADGPDATGFGYVNAPFIAAGTTNKQFNNYGGEDRFWLGPEAGQFGLYIRPGDPFDIDHWVVPAAFNEGAWAVGDHGPHHMTLTKRMEVTNHSGTTFRLDAWRQVRVLPRDQVEKHLGVTVPPGVKLVAYQTLNRIVNRGPNAWVRATGLPSIWILGQYNPSPDAVVIVPFKPGPDQALGPKVKTDYFGTIPPERLRVGDHYLVFKTDGLYRSKIGIPRPRAVPVLGSYDFAADTLTLVQYTLGTSTDYVNSLWKQQKEPYGGDVVNSYNDGPVKPGGAAMGGFYELETSSPAAALKPGHQAEHVHRTIHLTGPRQALAVLVQKVLGVRLSDARQILP